MSHPFRVNIFYPFQIFMMHQKTQFIDDWNRFKRITVRLDRRIM